MARDDQIAIYDVTIQLGVIRMPAAVPDSSGEPFYPRIALAVDAKSGMVLKFEMSQPGDDAATLAQTLFQAVAQNLGGLPRQVHVRDLAVAQSLRDMLNGDPMNIVAVRESLPMLDEAFAGFGEFKAIGSRPPEPGLLEEPGMSLERVIAFAEAAREFYLAEPWQHLLDEDLIKIESPSGPKGTAFSQVLGAGGQTFGLGFVPSIEAHEQLLRSQSPPRGGVWTLQFGHIDLMSFADGQMWEQHRLPLASEEAFPWFIKFFHSKLPEHPSPEELTWAEGLLRALAATTESQVDAGRWEVTVATFNGEQTYRLSLPFLLQDLATMPAVPEAASPGESAIALAEASRSARGRAELHLLRRALQLDPDYTRALLLMANRTTDDTVAIELLERAGDVEARQLGEESFREHAGHFWMLAPTRPYMHVRSMLAYRLMVSGRTVEAINHLNELLRLNPNDNQGNRYVLARALLQVDDMDALAELLDRPGYVDDVSAGWLFTRALLSYRRGDRKAFSEAILRTAAAANPHVIPMLIGRTPLPMQSPMPIGMGDESEAAEYVSRDGSEWDATPGAMEWLESFHRSVRKAKTAKTVKKSKAMNKPKAAKKTVKRPKSDP
jgi:tetratricopeptide (TPR) repeat protein